ncbi:MAG: ABC transporter substrate-binding protein [Leptospiraceae bacterium]|nr:ABC transporter substrate-binding protein [Leptospiraceae bacterium]MCP5493900.1 ABC transporter substrate-binding protein [Leptospiraceae bacterium]
MANSKIIKFITKYYRLFIFLILFISLSVWITQKLLEEDDLGIHIAMVGPITGPDSANGKSYKEGINLYLTELNNQGGLNGEKVVLDIYDDQNKKELAETRSQEVIKDGKAIGVIGHNSSSCSMRAGPIYKKYGIPAISPASTNVGVTIGNEWYFRTIFNDKSQGRFLANYAKKVLKPKSFSIIYEDLSYGSYLKKVFEETLGEQGVYIQNKWEIHPDSKNIDNEIKTVVDELKAKNDPGLVFIAVHPLEGAKLVKHIKDAGLKNIILAPDAIASQAFTEALSKYPEEVKNPGHYSNGIYVTTPLIFDNANNKAQRFKSDYQTAYKAEPDWRAAYAYDSVLTMVETVKKSKLLKPGDPLQETRKKIRDHLEKLVNIEDAIEGVTGFNYFDDQGDSPKPISIGIYRNNNIVSTFIQLQAMRDINEVSDLKQALQDETILEIDGKYLYQTNVVYTGIEMIEISNLDMSKLIFDMEFYIWFRYKGNIDPQNIDFLNTVKSVPIKDKEGDNEEETEDKKKNPQNWNFNFPDKMKSSMEMKLVGEEKKGDLKYRVYHVKGQFKADTLPVKYVLGKHSLGINFVHKKLTRNNLIYVIDVVGMGITHKTSIMDKIDTQKILSPVESWSIDNVLFFQDILEKSPLGAIQYISTRNAKPEYSRFNVAVRVKKNDFSLRGAIPNRNVIYYLSISLIVFIGLKVMGRFQHFDSYSNLIWFLITVDIFIVLVSSEIVIVDKLVEMKNNYDLKLLTRGFDLLWWIIPAARLNQAIERFVWAPLEVKTGHHIPTVVRMFLASFIYLLTFFGIVAFVYEQKITSLLATSGVVAMIIGLAIQVNISNIFSGIAINIERPFRVGDWIQVGSMDEGKVVDITWRTTRIKTRHQLILSIPNSIASESPIQNFGGVDDIVEFWFTVKIDPAQNTKRVQKILLDSLYAAEGVLKNPAPYTRLNEFTDWSADYIIGYCWKDYGRKNTVRKAVWTSVWTHLYRAGIEPAIQRNEIHLFKGIKARGEEALKPLTLLKEIDIFQSFSEEEKAYLSDRMIEHNFIPGEMIVHIGDTNDSMFVIAEGVVSVQTKLENGNYIEVASLGAGNFFGEMALLTGAIRTANIISTTNARLYEITKRDVDPLLEKHPEIFSMVNKVSSRRKEDTETQKQRSQIAPEPEKLNFFQKIYVKMKKMLVVEG